jgi:hypothetical protein
LSGVRTQTHQAEFRIGMEPLGKWCKAASVDEGEVQEQLERIVEGGGGTDSTWIEEDGCDRPAEQAHTGHAK